MRRVFDNRRRRQDIIETIMFGNRRRTRNEEQEAEQLFRVEIVDCKGQCITCNRPGSACSAQCVVVSMKLTSVQNEICKFQHCVYLLSF